MPITLSQIIEDSPQADGRRWITEEHTDSTDKPHLIRYLAELGVDCESVMVARVTQVNQQLINSEISQYLDDVESGIDVISKMYTETDQTYRAGKFYGWVQEKINQQDYQALKYTPAIIDQFTEIQLDNLLGEGNGVTIKTMVEKIRAMNNAVDGLEV